MYTSLLSRMKIEHRETLHKAETRKPEKVKAVLDVLEKKDCIGELTISETIDIIELVKAPTNNYNYIWEMFNEN